MRAVHVLLVASTAQRLFAPPARPAVSESRPYAAVPYDAATLVPYGPVAYAPALGQAQAGSWVPSVSLLAVLGVARASFASSRGHGKVRMSDADKAAAQGRAAARMVATAEAPVHVTAKSAKLMAEARTLMPGGVSSPVRAFNSVGGEPVVFDRVKGSKAYDVDGNEYVDYVGTWGPAIVGHADDTVLVGIKETMDKGTSFGAPCALENELAKMVIDAVPSVEMVRFTNSGTEACMGVLRLMRAFTKREKVIKFDGCYHGHADSFLVAAGSGVATLGLPDSPGVTKGASASTLVATYNDLDSVKKLFEANKGEIAGVILEPVVGNSGFIVPDQAFLQGLRDLCTAEGAVLTFDEVMTGFRISYGGAQKHWGITPDLSTFGKVIGGGLPVGAYAGKKEIMEGVAPAGPMYQAGTLSD